MIGFNSLYPFISLKTRTKTMNPDLVSLIKEIYLISLKVYQNDVRFTKHRIIMLFDFVKPKQVLRAIQ